MKFARPSQQRQESGMKSRPEDPLGLLLDAEEATVEAAGFP